MTVITAGTPWNGMSTSVAGLMTAEEVLEKAQLDWEVELRTVSTVDRNGAPMRFPGKWATVRKDNDQSLGIVGGDYRTLNNRDAFAVTTPLATLGAAYDSAGDRANGTQIFVTMKLERLVLEEDPHDVYLFVQTSHNSSKSIQLIVTPIRRRCTNQDALIARTAENRWSIRHLSTMPAKLAEAQESLKKTFKYIDTFEDTARRLLDIDLEVEAFEKILTATLPKAVRQRRAVDGVLRVRETSPFLEDIRPTAWGALQAWTEWTDHHREYRSQPARLKGIMDGDGARIRNALAQKLIVR